MEKEITEKERKRFLFYYSRALLQILVNKKLLTTCEAKKADGLNKLEFCPGEDVSPWGIPPDLWRIMNTQDKQ